MQGKAVRFGLICGAAGLVANICVSAAIGFCGPLTGLAAGAAAGFLAARNEQLTPRASGAQRGALAGGIAGGLTLIGQLIGGILALLFLLNSGMQPLLGTLPAEGDSASQIAFWIGGLGFGLCLGVLGVVLGTGGGALAGYLATPEQPAAPSGV